MRIQITNKIYGTTKILVKKMKALTILTLSVLLVQTLSRSVLPTTRKLLSPLADLTSKNFIWISDSTGALKQFDEMGNLVKNYSLDDTNIFSMVVTPDKQYLLFSSENPKTNSGKGSINLNQLYIPTQTVVKVYEGYSGDNEVPLVVTSDSRTAIAATDVGGNYARIKLFDLATQTQTSSLPLGFNFDLGTTALALSPDNKFLYVGGEYGSLL